jgi:hypothetical protein
VPQAGVAVALVVAAVHVALRPDRAELTLIGLAALAGLLLDSTLAATGMVRFAAAWPEGMAPWWMLSLWIAFATTLRHSLRWLMEHPRLAALAGSVGGPLAYWAGARLGALSIDTPARTLPLIAALWAVTMLALSLAVQHGSTPRGNARLPA